MDIQNLRWWGWGTLDEEYSLEDLPDFWPRLQEWLALPDEAIERESTPVSLGEISLPSPRLDDPMLSSLRKVVGEEAVRTDKRTRVEHAYGKSYRDLIRIRAGHIPHPPDVVVYPPDQGKVVSLLAWAADRDVVVIPFGGGTSVLGDVEPPADAPFTITLDLAHLNHLLAIDPASRTARLQAGARGPVVEAQLNERGFTLGHFPRSFEFSTLGGWIATRAAGRASIGYGKIEDMTQALRVVTPVGILETKDVPASATGPSVRDMLVGSEGALGVITEATMRIHPSPEVQDCRGILFRDFEEGVAALRDLMQSRKLLPSLARLSDASETAARVALSPQRQGLRQLVDQAISWYVETRGYDPTAGSALLLLGFDGDRRWAAQQWNLALDICRDYRGLSLGQAVGRLWKRERNALPYLRDTLLGHGIMVDTLETATSWSNLLNLYERASGALKGAITANGGGPGYVMTHISHASEQGASLCFTFLGRQLPTSDPLAKQAQWEGIKEAATDAILAAGGTLSHHYGVGRDHAPWLERELGQMGVKTLRALKRTLDPGSMMNPGVLLPK